MDMLITSDFYLDDKLIKKGDVLVDIDEETAERILRIKAGKVKPAEPAQGPEPELATAQEPPAEPKEETQNVKSSKSKSSKKSTES